MGKPMNVQVCGDGDEKERRKILS